MSAVSGVSRRSTSATRACSSRRLRNESPSYAASRIRACRNRNVPAVCGSRSTNSVSRSHDSESSAASGSPARTCATRSPENVVPSTDAQRRSARSPGASCRCASSRPRGRSPASSRTSRPCACVAATSSRTKSGLPPERSVIAARSSGAMASSAADTASAFASSSGSGSSRSVTARHRRHAFRCDEASARRVAASRRRTTASRSRGVPRWRRRSDDASSIQWASSKWTSVGVSSSVRRAVLDHAVQARAAERRLQLVDLRRRQHGDVEHVTEERRPLHELGRDGLDRVAELDRVAFGVAAQLDGRTSAAAC